MTQLRITTASVIVAFFTAACGTAEGDDPTHAAMFRGGPSHPGVADAEAGSRYGGILWRVATDGPVRSSPVIADGVVYVGSSDGRLYAIDAGSGEVRWSAAADGPVDASPAVTGDLVLAADRSGALLALDRATGERSWRVATGPTAPWPWGGESGDYYTASPVVVDGTGIFGGGDGIVYAIDVGSGDVRWRFETDGRVRSTPAVAGGTVYAGSADGSLYAIALADGRRLWRFDTEGRSLDSSRFGYDRRSITSSPTVVDGTVYFGSRDGSLYAVDAETGALRWRSLHDDTSWSIASPAVVDGVVLDASSDAAFIRGVDAATGEEIWRVDTPSSVWPSPVVAGGTAWFVTGSGVLHGVDPATGAVVERVALGERTFSSPWIDDGVLYLGTDAGSVLAIRLVGETGLARAVFWDPASAEANTVPGAQAVRDWFVERGYAELDADGLADFLAARVDDGARSVVVFAQDDLPATVAATASDTTLFRRWLEAGGKAVWLGMPPLIWPPGPAGRSYAGIDREATERLLGVPHDGALFDRWGARVTQAGRAWGPSGWWLGRWSVPVEGVDQVLAVDENGRAAAWAESYGGPPGTGFFRIEAAGDDPARLAEVAAVAERFPAR